MALYQFNGETASALYLDGRIIKIYKTLPLKMTYKINNPSELHEFNSEFKYAMDRINNGDGTFTINIYSKNDFTLFRCNKNTISIDYIEMTGNVTDMSYMFYNCKSLKEIKGIEDWNTSNVTDMSYMFYNCNSLASLDVSNWDVANVIYADSMFTNIYRYIDWKYDGYNYTNFTLTEEQTGYAYTFPWNTFYTITVNYIDDNNEKITSPYVTTVKYKNTYDVSSKSNIEFYGYIHLDTNGIIKGTATGDRTINVLYENRNYVEYTVDYGIIGHVNINHSTGYDEDGYKHYYFLPSRVNIEYVLLTLTDGKTSKSMYTRIDKVEKIRCYYINSAKSFSFKDSNVKDILSLGTIRLTTTREMFYGCDSLTSFNASNWNTSNVTDMNGMFCHCTSLTSLDLSNWDTSNVTDMNNMFFRVPTWADWHYDGTNYQNWTLTEEQTDFSGTFPWNK